MKWVKFETRAKKEGAIMREKNGTPNGRVWGGDEHDVVGRICTEKMLLNYLINLSLSLSLSKRLTLISPASSQATKLSLVGYVVCLFAGKHTAALPTSSTQTITLHFPFFLSIHTYTYMMVKLASLATAFALLSTVVSLIRPFIFIFLFVV